MANKKRNKIVSIGSYNVGLTVRTGRIPTWGETLIGSGFSESYGGKGSNQAVAAAKLGGDVTFIGSLGKDKYGDDGIAMMEEFGIDTSHIRRVDGVSSGVGIILLNDDNDNCIIVDLGANNKLTAGHLKDLEHVIAEAEVVIFQLEIPLETVKYGMELAKKLGKTTIFNPAPANPEAIDLLSMATIVNPNESELLILNGKSPDKKISESECVELARNLLAKGPETVIVTRGEKGSIVITEQDVKKVGTVKVDAVDTTGAGDAFTGSLAVALAEGKDMLEAVKLASLTGAYCVTKEEVIPGLPTRNELYEFQRTHT